MKTIPEWLTEQIAERAETAGFQVLTGALNPQMNEDGVTPISASAFWFLLGDDVKFSMVMVCFPAHAMACFFKTGVVSIKVNSTDDKDAKQKIPTKHFAFGYHDNDNRKKTFDYLAECFSKVSPLERLAATPGAELVET